MAPSIASGNTTFTRAQTGATASVSTPGVASGAIAVDAEPGARSRTWFTSDLHLGHPFVAGLRGFEVTREHDEKVLENLVATVGPCDTLWVLGDISSGWGKQERRALEYLGAAFGELRAAGQGAFRADLIAGNHDSAHPLHSNSFAKQREFLEVFDSVQSMQHLVWRDRDVWLCHFPRPGYDHEGMDSRHDHVRLEVNLLVHGHLHSPTPITGPGQVDVGLDAWGLRPVAEETVMDTLFASVEDSGAAPEGVAGAGG